MEDVIEEQINHEQSFKSLISLRDCIVKEIVDIQAKLREIQNRSVTFVGEAIEKVGVFEYATKFTEEFQHISNNIEEFVRDVEHPLPILCYSNKEHGKKTIKILIIFLLC